MTQSVKVFGITALLCCFSFAAFCQEKDSISFHPTLFCSTTNLYFEIDQNDSLTSSLFNVWGENFGHTFQNQYFEKGKYMYPMNWDSLNLATGNYLFQLQGNNTDLSIRILKRCNTNIQDFSEENPPLFFPNPTHGWIQIHRKDVHEIEIFNMQGKRLATFKNPSSAINLSHLPKSVYFIQFKNQHHETVGFQKMVVSE